MSEWEKFRGLCGSAKSAGPGARFIAIDFHLHTPASGKDYRDGGPETYHKIAQKLAEQKIDAVFVTDHNAWEGIELLSKAVKDAGFAIQVYPGVELTIEAHAIRLRDGEDRHAQKIKPIFFHCLAFLPPSPDVEKKIESLVTNNHKNPDVLKARPYERKLAQDISEVARRVHDWDGCFLPAHLNQGKGAEKSRSYDDIYSDQVAIQYLDELFDVVEVRKLDSVQFFDGKHRGMNGSLIPERACILGSDSHRIDQIGSKITYLLVENNIFLDIVTSLRYRERLRYTPPNQSKDCITDLLVEGTFLGNVHFAFNPQVSALIGTKGAGKSAVLECIRFALGVPPAGDVEKYLNHILGPSGRVWAAVKNRQGESFLFVRGRRDSSPRVISEKGASLERDSVVPRSFPVEIRGWGEVINLSQDKSAQLRLIDAFDKSGEAKQLSDKINGFQTRLPLQFKKARTVFDRFKAAKTELDELTLKKERLDKLTVEKLVDEQREKERRDAELASYRELAMALDRNKRVEFALISADTSEQIKGLKQATSEGKLTSGQNAAGVLREIDTLAAKESGIASEFKDVIARAEKIVLDYIAELENQFAPLDSAYQEKIAELDPNEQDVLLARNEIVQELVKLPGVQTRFDVLANELETHLHEYGSLLEEIHKLTKRRSKVRARVVEELNTRLSATGVHTRVKIAHDVLTKGKLPTGAKPADVFDSLSRGFKTLNANTALSSYLLSTLLDGRDEFLLDINDQPTIEFQLYPGVWRATEQLSAGQKSTAVLPLIIMLGEGPVILDQPEDNLDNKYIGSMVVRMLLTEKERRQFILSSHNATVVVMADSELVAEMIDKDGKANFVAVGFLNGPHSKIRSSVLEVLDGGEKALKRRFMRYGLT